MVAIVQIYHKLLYQFPIICFQYFPLQTMLQCMHVLVHVLCVEIKVLEIMTFSLNSFLEWLYYCLQQLKLLTPTKVTDA